MNNQNFYIDLFNLPICFVKDEKETDIFEMKDEYQNLRKKRGENRYVRYFLDIIF